MVELLQANWVLVVVALLIGVLVAWWIFVASRRTKVQLEERDDSDETGARRNQALIDAPPVAAKDPASPPAAAPTASQPAATDPQDVEAGRNASSPGPTSAAANSDATAASPLGTDAETGDGVPMRKAMQEMPASQKSETGPAASPAPTPAPAPTVASAPVEGDDLKRIKGVGPKLVGILHEHGITRFDQIAAWSDADIDRVDAQLGRFQGRIRRDNWVEQARLLQSGDTAAYEAKFGATS